MAIEDTLARIHQCGVIAVVRGIADVDLDRTVGALLEGGIDCVEVVMSVHGALREMASLKERYGNRVMIGAGDVLNAEMVVLAHAAQADFCSGVGANAAMIRACNERDLLALPGALTPTEIHNAWHAGAGMVKLYPADLLGPAYVETVHRTLPRVELVPSGGITADNAGLYIAAGAVAVGAGLSVVDPNLVASGDFEAVTRNAAALVAAVKNARTNR